MKEYNCCLEEDGNWFRYRAAAIIIEDNCILFAGNEKENYLYSIGGGVHIGESSEEAVKREVYEETGVHYEVDRLAFIHENFFDGNGYLLKNKKCHEIAFYYLMKPRGTKKLNSNSQVNGVKEEMHWIPIEDLEKYKAYPTFFRDKLKNLKKDIEHIVTIES